MKKFLEFIWELVGPSVTYIFVFFLGMIMFGWVLSLFGLLFLFEPTTPTWFKWTVGVFDFSLIILIIYKWISNAYKKIYKPELYEKLD